MISNISIDEALAAALARTDVPGAVVLVTNRDGVLYEGACGVADVVTGRKLEPNAMFRIASMTKAITSVALMQLVEQGALELDDPVAKFLPVMAEIPVIADFDGATGAATLRPASNDMTTRHVLTHTSGLGYPFTSATLRDFKPHTGESHTWGPLLFEPGTQWWYGTSTDIVGRLVEAISGERLEDYFRRHIFAPLDMPDTSYSVPAAEASRMVAAHQRAGAGLDGVIVKLDPQPPLAIAHPAGGGGLTSTASDYGRFLRCLLNGGELEGKRLLQAQTVALMGENHIGDIGVAAHASALPRSADFTFIADRRDKWGLGFLITSDQVPGKRAPGSLSWGGINNTYFWIDPAHGIAGVIMMQFLPFADAKALAVYDAVERAVYHAIGK